jgi:hypothetical protein
VLVDLSQSGAFVATQGVAPVRLGQCVQLATPGEPLGLGRKGLTARVVWKGDKRGQPGFGVIFEGGEAARVGELLARHARLN